MANSLCCFFNHELPYIILWDCFPKFAVIKIIEFVFLCNSKFEVCNSVWILSKIWKLYTWKGRKNKQCIRWCKKESLVVWRERECRSLGFHFSITSPVTLCDWLNMSWVFHVWTKRLGLGHLTILFGSKPFDPWSVLKLSWKRGFVSLCPFCEQEYSQSINLCPANLVFRLGNFWSQRHKFGPPFPFLCS